MADWFDKRLEELKQQSKQGATQPVVQTPQPKAQPQFDFGGVVGSAVGKAGELANAGFSGVLKPIGDVLSVPNRFLGGAISGANQGAAEFRASKGYKPGQVLKAEDALSGVGSVLKGGISGAIKGKSIYDASRESGMPAPMAFTSDLVLDPINLAGGVFSKGASYLPKLGTAIEKTVPLASKVRDAVGAFQYGYKTPANFLKKYESLHAGLGKAAEFAGEVAKPLKYGPDGKELPKVTQTALGEVFKIMSEGSNRALTPDELKMVTEFQPLIDKTFKTFKGLAEQQIKLGVRPEVFDKLLGKYYGKRSYLKILDEAKPFVEPKSPRLDLSVYKNRADIPEQARKAMGEVVAPAYGAATAAFTEASNIEKTKFFRWVAKKFVDQGENLVKLPETPKLGPISGRMVPKEIKGYLDQIIEPGGGLGEKAIQFFKKGKTIWSPPQLLRNIVTSQVQAFMNPGGSATSFTRIPEALKEIKNQGKFYKLFKRMGGTTTFAGTELGKYVPEEVSKYGKKIPVLSKASDFGKSVQQINEEMSKLQVFINEIKSGRTAEEAFKMAENTGFNYQKVSPLVAKLRKGLIPFLTYPLKAGELTAKTLVKNPGRLAAIQKGERAVESVVGPGPNEDYLPGYQEDAVRVGKPNEKGATPYVNSKYFYPWGNFGDITPLPFGLSPNPLITEAASQLSGKDIVTGAKVGQGNLGEDLSSPLGLLSRGRHALETFAPRPVRSGLKIADTLTKNAIRSTTPNTSEAILQELGLPYFKYDSRLGMKFAGINRTDAKSQAKKNWNNFRRDYGGKLPDDLFKKIEEYYRQQYVDVIRAPLSSFSK